MTCRSVAYRAVEVQWHVVARPGMQWHGCAVSYLAVLSIALACNGVLFVEWLGVWFVAWLGFV